MSICPTVTQTSKSGNECSPEEEEAAAAERGKQEWWRRERRFKEINGEGETETGASRRVMEEPIMPFYFFSFYT